MAGEIGRRMPGIDKGCKICGAHEESIVHMLFHCTIACIVRFMSPLTMRTDGIMDELKQILINLLGDLD